MLNITKELKKVEVCRDRIAKQRDKLREIVEEFEGELDIYDKALVCLEEAIDEISQVL